MAATTYIEVISGWEYPHNIVRNDVFAKVPPLSRCRAEDYPWKRKTLTALSNWLVVYFKMYFLILKREMDEPSR